MGTKIKNLFSVAVIILLLPLIITISMKGSSVVAENSGAENEVELLLPGILAATIPSDYEEETLKAQAVILRTLIVGSDEKDAKEAAEKLKLSIRKEWDTVYAKAVEATTGEVLFYKDELTRPAYHALSTGRTRSSAEATGEDIPYLQAVDSSWDKECGYYENLTEEESGQNITVVDRDSSGYVQKVIYGEEEITGEEFRKRLSLPSADFSIAEKYGKRVILTRGVGHGLGMSQYGANEVAKKGYSYRKILKYYFKGTQVRYFYE